jgi:hypothetical protein
VTKEVAAQSRIEKPDGTLSAHGSLIRTCQVATWEFAGLIPRQFERVPTLSAKGWPEVSGISSSSFSTFVGKKLICKPDRDFQS